MKKALVVGLGVSGRSTVNYLQRLGVEVFGFDDRINQYPKGVHPFLQSDFKKIDCVIVSPGIPRTHPIYRQSIQIGVEVIGEAELACRSIFKPVIAVTGTNGKTTVTLHITHILKQCGYNVRLLGNGGVPITSECMFDADLFVLELSSFQLETFISPVIDFAALLNITPDHLDRYATMEEYANTKLHIKNCLKSSGTCFVHANVYKNYCSKLNQDVVVFSGKTHEDENNQVVFGICSKLGLSYEKIVKASQSFQKPPHRIQFVKTIDGIDYYNDSKGTNLDAVIRCIEFLGGPIILIAGGVDKGASYRCWISAFRNKVKTIITIGQAAEKIEKELKAEYTVYRCHNLEDAVYKASERAETGDKIVLSPGCSSFDMFKDYADRGEIFKKIVHELK